MERAKGTETPSGQLTNEAPATLNDPGAPEDLRDRSVHRTGVDVLRNGRQLALAGDEGAERREDESAEGEEGEGRQDGAGALKRRARPWRVSWSAVEGRGGRCGGGLGGVGGRECRRSGRKPHLPHGAAERRASEAGPAYEGREDAVGGGAHEGRSGVREGGMG